MNQVFTYIVKLKYDSVMKQLMYLFLLLCLLGIASQIHAENLKPSIEFTDSYLSGRELSQEKGKPLVVYFFENGNTACEEMKSIWHSKSVVEKLNDNYVCSRVNINHFDGETLKKYHKIESAPAVIILSPSGKVKRRINTKMSENEFIAFLNGNASSIQSSAEQQKTTVASSEEDENETVKEEKPKTNASESSLKNAFTIQIGVYSTAVNARSKVTDLKRIFNEPIRSIETTNSSKTLYRVVIGEFPDRPTADSYLQLVKKYDIKGFVKSLPL